MAKTSSMFANQSIEDLRGHAGQQAEAGEPKKKSDDEPLHDGCGTWEKYDCMAFALVWPEENGEYRQGVGYDELVAVNGSFAELRARGQLRLEGKDYVVEDGEVCHFRFNVAK